MKWRVPMKVPSQREKAAATPVLFGVARDRLSLAALRFRRRGARAIHDLGVPLLGNPFRSIVQGSEWTSRTALRRLPTIDGSFDGRNRGPHHSLIEGQGSVRSWRRTRLFAALQ